MFEVTVEFTDSYYTKLNPETYVDSAKECMKYMADILNDEIKDEAPVRTGRLREGHYVREDNGLSYFLCNNVEYAPYVIYGTSRQAPNDYPTRVMNRVNVDRVESLFSSSLITKGVL